MKTLDLFSGLGGFAYALRHVCRPVAFCENDDAATAVLRRRFPKIPVLENVKTLKTQDVAHYQPEMITAGFPCQDISCLRVYGQATGIDGPRSKLFFEVPRLIKGLKSVKHVVLENSPCIYNRGLDRVVSSLRKVGMTHFAYGVFSAREVGAPHVRKRWFCVASRAPQELPLISNRSLKNALSNEWNALETVPRVIRNSHDTSDIHIVKKRLSLLGNSVVPQTVAYAYQSLATSLQELSDYSPKTKKEKNKTTASLYTSKVISIISPKHQYEIPRVDVLKEKITISKNLPLLRLVDDHGTEVLRHSWRTPTGGESSWNQARKMTDRALWNPGNMIYYESRTHCPESPTISDRSRYCIINPEYIERMMGYPLGWTCV